MPNPFTLYLHARANRVLVAAFLVFTVLAFVVPANAQDQAPQPPPGAPQAPTAPGTRSGSSKNAIIGHIEKLFTARPASLLLGSVVAGGGTGVGGHYIKDFSRDPWEREFRATALVTIRAFSMQELQLRFAHNSFTPFGETADKFNMHIFVRNRDLRKMPFYGLGPHPNFALQALFHERDTLAGLDATDPLVSWLAVGGRLETMWHDANDVTSPKAQTITALYPGTPGLSPQPNLMHYELFLRPHYPAQPPFNIDYRISYGYYQDHDTGTFSFRRLTLNAYNNIYPFHLSDGSTNGDIFLTLHGLLTESDASFNHLVPFYLQPTLGGTDANGDPTLRGYKDFQFRGPNALLFQAEYNHRFYKYLGGFLFYDAGKVALRRSDIDFTNLRQSYGFGVSFWMNDLVLFKIYVGLGSGQGVHPFFGIPNFTGANLVTGRGPAATPWD